METTYIIPMLPTPDAELHLGHAAGPYLSADFYHRLCKQVGKGTVLVSGIDSFENWCAPVQGSESPNKIDTYLEAFRRLRVDFDSFLDPTAARNCDAYKTTLRGIFNYFDRGGFLIKLSEKLFFDSKTDNYGIHSNIEGQCPACGAWLRGNSCISCFHHAHPFELRSPRMRNIQTYETREVENFFLKLDNETAFSSIGLRVLPTSSKKIAETWINDSNLLLRLSYPDNFGVSLPGSDGLVLSNTFFQCCHWLVNSVQIEKHDGSNGEAQVVAFMGLDNVIPCGLGSLYMSRLYPGLSFKRIYTNQMLSYEGKKFSKSRAHGPTINAYTTNLDGLGRSALRVFLSMIDLSEVRANFTENSFLQFEAGYRNLACCLLDIVRNIASNSDAVKGLRGGRAEHIGTNSELIEEFDRPRIACNYLENLKLVVGDPTFARLSEFLVSAEVVDPHLYELATAAICWDA